MESITERNTINPATNKAAPTGKFTAEFVPFIDIQIHRPEPIATIEIIISRMFALSTK
jgi:hypothetical protein